MKLVKNNGSFGEVFRQAGAEFFKLEELKVHEEEKCKKKFPGLYDPIMKRRCPQCKKDFVLTATKFGQHRDACKSYLRLSALQNNVWNMNFTYIFTFMM